MNFKSAFIFGFLLTFCLLLNCSNSPNGTQAVDAKITLIDWSQTPFDTNSQGDTLYLGVRLNYKIENTGAVDIANYEVYFKAETINSQIYESSDSGEDLRIGEIDINSARIETNLNKAIKVEITGQFLEPVNN